MVTEIPVHCNVDVQEGDRVEIQSTDSTVKVVFQILKLFLFPLIGFWLVLDFSISY